MRRSDTSGENNFESWIEHVGQNKAPEGFSQKVMAQVEVEALSKLERYSTPVSMSFKVAVVVLFAVLTIVSIILPEGTVFFFTQAGSINLPQIPFPAITLPEVNYPDWIRMEYLAIGGTIIIILFILDRYLGRLFKA
jgi:hypothetical protein